MRQKRDRDLSRRGSSRDCFNWKNWLGVCEGRKEHGENKLEVGTKSWELPQVYCLGEIEEESSGQEVEEDGEQGESDSRGKLVTSTAALAMSQFRWLCRQLAVDQPLGGKLVTGQW